jgi:hypothetical protein
VVFVVALHNLEIVSDAVVFKTGAKENLSQASNNLPMQ